MTAGRGIDYEAEADAAWFERMSKPDVQRVRLSPLEAVMSEGLWKAGYIQGRRDAEVSR